MILLAACSLTFGLAALAPAASAGGDICFHSADGNTYCCPPPPTCGPREMCPMYLWEPCYIAMAEKLVPLTT